MKNSIYLRGFIVAIIVFAAITANAQLSGTKVIGVAPSDYTTFSDAVNALNTSGVNGPVVFQVKPGTYNENIWIDTIVGASATNSVTFTSQTSDSTSVILTYSPSSWSDNYTLYMIAADYVTFSHLTLASGGTSYANVVVIDSAADHNTFTHCRFEGYLTNMASTNHALVYSSGFNEHYNTFSNNNFYQGSYGLYYYGLSSKENGTVIRDNQFIEQYYSGIYLSNQNAAIVTGNYIYSTSYTSFRAIQSQYCDNKMIITKNKIDIPNSGGGYGIYITNSESTAGNEALIANNFFHINTSGSSCAGINCTSSSYQKIYHNSVYVSGANTTSYGIIFDGYGTAGLLIKNNIFANYAGGPANYCFLSNSLFAVDYNAYYTSGTNLCNYYGTLALLSDWQSATSEDAHSIALNPTYISSSDLHISTPSLLSAAGVHLVDITDDIDGEIRNTTPDIGADEFTVVSLSESIAASAVSIYPNPSHDNIVVNCSIVPQQYRIVDITGKEISKGIIEQTSTLDISNLKPGIYFMLLDSENGKSATKFVKSNF